MESSKTPALPFYIGLAGPTAAGKTAAALYLAEQLAHTRPVEIISVDSALVYRGMDIGTAKPSAHELALVPHHLINIRDPLEAYSAAEFVRDASARIRDIASRGKLPLLVGGTMLYFKALLDGLDDMPAANPAIRSALEQEAQAKGWPALHAELAQIDPATAARLAPQDSQRIQRALEVHRITGRPMSAFHQRRNTNAAAALNAAAPGNTDADADTGTDTTLAPAHILISLEPNDRGWLHHRIAQRFSSMLHEGFLNEVEALRARSDLHPDLPSMRCVGYRQAWEALDGQWPVAELQERGTIATRQLAKRQLTWLRAMPHRKPIACDQPDYLQQVLTQVRNALSSPDAA
jgi:tRNA dimethylallyltransferase